MTTKKRTPLSMRTANPVGDRVRRLATCAALSSFIACIPDAPDALQTLRPNIEVSDAGLDFHDVWMGDARLRSFQIENTGTAKATFSFVSVEGDASFSLDESQTGPSFTDLDAGASVTVNVRFSPHAPGPTSARVVFETDAANPRREIALTGNGLDTPTCVSPSDCVTSTFDFTLGTCVQQPREGSCDDDNACVVDGVCVDGRCLGRPRLCPSVGGCVSAVCDPSAGCTTTLDHASCDTDDNPCTDGECRDDGTCTVVVKDDLDFCSDTFSCEAGVSLCQSGVCVAFSADGFPCSDGSLCTDGDVCDGATCASGVAVAGPPAVVDVVPLFPTQGSVSAVGPVFASPTAMGLVIWEVDASSALVARSVLDDVWCSINTIIALSDTRFACVMSVPGESKVVVVDVTDGTVIDELTPPLTDAGEPQTFRAPLFSYGSALFVVVANGVDRHLARAAFDGGGVDDFVAVLPVNGWSLTGGGRFLLDRPTPDFLGAAEPGVVIDLGVNPPASLYALIMNPNQNLIRTRGAFALTHSGTDVVVLDLNDVTTFVSAGTNVGTAPQIAVPGFAPSLCDLQDDAVIGLDSDSDVIRVQSLNDTVLAPAPLAVPGASMFRRIGEGAWLIGPGRIVTWRAGAMIEERNFRGQFAAADLAVIDDQPHLVVAPHIVDQLVPLTIDFDGGLSFGPAVAMPRNEGDRHRIGYLFGSGAPGYVFSHSISPLVEEARVMNRLDDGTFFIEVMPHTPLHAPLGVMGDVVVDHAPSTHEFVIRQHGVFNSYPILFAGTVPEDVVVDMMALSMDVTDLDVGPYDATLVTKAAIDASNNTLVIVSGVVVESYFLESAGELAFLSPPQTFTLLEHLRVRVVSLADPWSPAVVVDHILSLPHRLESSRLHIAVKDQHIVVYVDGLHLPEVGPSFDRSLFVIGVPPLEELMLGGTAVSVTSVALPDGVNFSSSLHLIAFDEASLDVVSGPNLWHVDLGETTTATPTALPETPSRVLSTSDASYLVGATTLTLVSPGCP